MRFHEFLGKVQDRARHDSPESAMRATRVTLNTLDTLAERLRGNEPAHVAAQLPGEIGEHLCSESAGRGERFSADDFVDRVSEREGVSAEEASRHAQVILDVVSEAVSPGEMADIKQQLPEDYHKFFPPTRH